MRQVCYHSGFRVVPPDGDLPRATTACTRWQVITPTRAASLAGSALLNVALVIAMSTARNQLRVLLALSLTQAAIFVRLLSSGSPGGELLECMMPPCQRAYPLWLSLCVFGGLAAASVQSLNALATGSAVASSAFIYGTIAVAISAFAIDTHYMHPIPHAGPSLNPLMFSHVKHGQQALLPFLSCVLSVGTMAMNMIVHRALAGDGAAAGPTGQKKQK